MALTPATSKQVPEHSILDHFNKQVYLGNQFSAVAGVATSGTAEAGAILLTCPVGGLNQKSLFVDLRRAASVTSANSVIVKAYVSPSAAAGATPLVPVQMRPANTVTTSIASASTAPTVTSNGSLVDVLAGAAFTTLQSDRLIILDPGQSLLITVQTSASATTVELQLSWYEL